MDVSCLACASTKTCWSSSSWPQAEAPSCCQDRASSAWHACKSASPCLYNFLLLLLISLNQYSFFSLPKGLKFCCGHFHWNIKGEYWLSKSSCGGNNYCRGGRTVPNICSSRVCMLLFGPYRYWWQSGYECCQLLLIRGITSECIFLGFSLHLREAEQSVGLYFECVGNQLTTVKLCEETVLLYFAYVIILENLLATVLPALQCHLGLGVWNLLGFPFVLFLVTISPSALHNNACHSKIRNWIGQQWSSSKKKLDWNWERNYCVLPFKVHLN